MVGQELIASPTRVCERGGMRFLFVGLNFSPELVGIGKYSGELIERFAQSYPVSVISALPHYPAWQIHPSERKRRWKLDERYSYPVRRVPIYVPALPSITRRIAHQVSFAAAITPAALYEALRFKPDVIATVAPALMAAPIVGGIARLIGARSWLHVQDFEVDVASGLSMIKHRRASAFAAAVEQRILRSFDLVSSISPIMVSHLAAKGVAPERVAMFPNWVDTSVIRPVASSFFRTEWRLRESAIVVLYSGSMGRKQGLEYVVDAARRLQNEREIFFVFCGEGTARKEIEARARGLAQVRFLDLQPADRLSELLGAADIHVLPQRAGAEGLVMPSKLGPMLASGRPIVATADQTSPIAEMIKGCGILVPPEDTQSLADTIRRLATATEQRRVLGAQARLTAERELSQDAILSRIEQCLLKLGSRGPISAAERFGGGEALKVMGSSSHG